MNKTIGMITFYKGNYGAILQAYALQKVLIANNFSPELINYDYTKDRTILGVPIAYRKKPLLFFKRLVAEIVRFRAHKDRESILARCVGEYLIESSKQYRNYHELLKNPPKYDLYLSGSDQVFNSDIYPYAFGSRLLEFVNKGKKVSYAASAGSTDLSDFQISRLTKALKEFNAISVREDKLRDELQSSINNIVYRHVDPTLLLNPDEWASFSKEVNIQGKYIFFYTVLPDKELYDAAESVSKQLNIPIYVADRNYRFSNQTLRKNTLSPNEWVWAIANADYVVTNSFHGTAFSILFHKPARILLPKKGSERIRDIISSCKLERLYETRIIDLNNEKGLFEEADKYINSQQVASFEYISQFADISSEDY